MLQVGYAEVINERNDVITMQLRGIARNDMMFESLVTVRPYWNSWIP